MFVEASDILCAIEETCRRIMAGYWLDQLVQKLQDKRDGKLNDTKMLVYATVCEWV